MSRGARVGLAVAVLVASAAVVWLLVRDRKRDATSARASWIPSSTAAARELGVALHEEGRLDEAQLVWEEVLARPDAEPEDQVRLACVWFVRWVKSSPDPDRVGEYARRTQFHCEEGLRGDPSLAAAHYMVGVMAKKYALDLDADAALPRLRRAFELAPGDDGARFHFAQSLEDAGDLDAAIETFAPILERGREFAGVYYPPALYRTAQLLRRRNRGDDRERVGPLLEQHGALGQPASKAQEEIDQALGTLGRPRHSTRVVTDALAGPAILFAMEPALLLGEAGKVASFDRADLDGDGRDDLVATGEGGTFVALATSDGGFRVAPVSADRGDRVVLADLEDEGGGKYGIGMAGVLVVAGGRVKLLLPREDGSFLDDTAKLPELAGILDVDPVDFDHDGNLDLLFATSGGLRLVRNHGVLRDDEGRREVDEEGRVAELAFTDVTEATGFAGVRASWVAIEDFDADQDVDLLAGGAGAPTTLFSNLRRGRFEAFAPERSGLAAEIALEPVAGDADADGIADVIVLGAGAAICRGKGDATFAAPRPLPALGAAGAIRGELIDVDLDGLLDLAVTLDGGALRWWPAAGMRDDALRELPGAGAPHAAPFLADLDRDLALDVVGLAATGLEWRRGALERAPQRVLMALRGRKDNHGAVGTVAEVRTGNRYQRRFVTRSTQLFGFAREPAGGATPIVRITWPDGVTQYPLQTTKPDHDGRPDFHEADGDPKIELPFDPTQDRRGVVEQRKGPPGSCPFLYAWNGERYEFVTDVLGATPLGLPIDGQRFVVPDHDELVRMTAAQLAPKEGEYRLQLTEELREVTYLDHAELWVVEHDADVVVHPEERFCFPPFPPRRVHAMRDVRPLERAVDQDGRDWSAELRAADGVHAVPFTELPERYRGIATLHSLELTLPDAARAAPRVRLLMTGWLDWGDASVNLAAARNGTVRFLPPVVSAPDPEGPPGSWRECGPPVGFPAGKTKTMVLDVTAMVNRADPRLRFTSTLELYWDRIEVALDPEDARVAITKLPAKLAELWFRGFSRPLPGRRADQPERFDWNELEPQPRWNQHRGMLTRYGDVRPLLAAIDDRLALFSAGDALDLRFDASSITPLAPGRSHTYLLALDGWAKDGDPNTVHSQTVEPLPFHGMSGYPFGVDEQPHDAAALELDRARWNTRAGRRLLQDLSIREAASPAAARADR